MDEYTRGVRDGGIKALAFAHFDVLHNGWVPIGDLHAWVEEKYGKQVADEVFPLEESA